MGSHFTALLVAEELVERALTAAVFLPCMSCVATQVLLLPNLPGYPTCLPTTYLRTYLPTYLPTYLLTYLPAY